MTSVSDLPLTAVSQASFMEELNTFSETWPRSGTMQNGNVYQQADLMPLTEMIVDSFRYPENEAWSVQADEQEQIVNGLKNLRGMWPLIRLIQALSPQ